MRKTLLLLLTLLLLPILSAQADILGTEVPEGAVSVDLSARKSVDVKALLRDLKGHPEVTEVDLTGVNINAKNKRALVEGAPEVTFRWTVKLGNLSFCTDDTVMDLTGLRGKISHYDIAMALHALPNIKKVSMYNVNSGLSDMENYLLEQFPDVEFEWTLNWIICSGRRVYLRTDATAFSTAKGRQDPRYTTKQIWQRLKYFPDLLAIDVGHNNVTDLSFLTNYPKLRRLIVIDSKRHVTDISALTDLMDLEYVELFMQEITDLSPLANHTKLIDLNVATNYITDLSPLYSCTSLKRLWVSSNPGLTQEEIDEFKKHVPGCTVVSNLRRGDETGGGWREHPHYDVLIKSFNDNTYYPFEDSAPLDGATDTKEETAP